MEEDYSFGKMVTFRCDSGYQLEGEQTLQCVLGDTPNDCKWSGELPKCKCKENTELCHTLRIDVIS